MQNWKLARKKATLTRRSRIIQAIREFFLQGGYLEVETPLRIPAPAPEAHIDAVPSGSWFLHTSPELCMKRLLAAGYQRIYQICHCWRDGERGIRHLPEFTMLEWYRTDSSYNDLMVDCENLVRFVSGEVGLGETVRVGAREVHLVGPWERISVHEAFSRYGGVPMEEALSRGIFDEVMVRDIEPRLGWEKPSFLLDYPAERGALARLKADDPSVAERFELYIGGVELANGFSELTDHIEQSNRFQQEVQTRASLNRPIYPFPDKFLQELPGMPPSAGIALGIDRLVMVLLNICTIDDIVTFAPEDL